MHSEKKQRLLFIDDSDTIKALILAGFKQHENVAVHWLTDPRLAVKEVQAIRPDICIVDVFMPHMDGREVFKELRKLQDLEACKLCFMTAAENETDMAELNALRPDRIFKKPFSVRQIVKEIQELMDAPCR